MRLALAQHSPAPLEVEVNVARTAALVQQASEAGVALVVFPELWLTGYDLGGIERTPAAWLQADDGRLDELRRCCQRAQVTAILGAPWLGGGDADSPSDPRPSAPRPPDPRPQLAAVVVHADGSMHASAKQHLHGREREVFRGGAPAPPFEVRGWRVAIAICFDMSKPAHALAAAAQGTDLYVGSSLYAVGEERRSDLQFGARAMDHRMFSALANYAGGGSWDGMVSCGRSGVWGPDGEVRCRAGSEATLLIADLPRAALDAFRPAPAPAPL